MAVPKKRVSKSRKGMRRSHMSQRFQAPQLSTCSRCGEPKLSHRVCANCGHYKDKEVLSVE
jgi:large subunit ribosomal protein L32